MSDNPRSNLRTVAVWCFVAAMVLGALLVIHVMDQARLRRTQAANVTAVVPVVTVDTVRPGSTEVPEELAVTGTVAAVDPMSVGPEVNGLRIEQVLVEEGARVRRGQVLAVLNRATLDAQLAQARARYRGSLAMANKAVQPNRPQDIQALRAAVSQARASEAQESANLREAKDNLQFARRTAQRYNQVRDDGFVTAQEAQDHALDVARYQAGLSAAEHRLSAARFASQQAAERLNLALAGGRREDVDSARATAGEMAADVQLLEAQLDQTVIRAPDDGLVTQRDAHIGDIVSPTKTLFMIARNAQLEMKAQVPEAELQSISVGDKAQVIIGKVSVPGKVWLVSPSVESNTRLGTARLMLDLSRGTRVLPGMFANASLHLGHHRAMTLPSAAVLGESDTRYVFRLVDGRARKVAVTTGVRTGDDVEIRKGVGPDDQIIVKGAGFLSDGDPVATARK